MAYPKKSLGQNFLTSVGAIQKIIASSDYSPGLTILEIGPGRGVLTEALLRRFDRVVAIEKDHELIDLLQEKFEREIRSGQLTLIEGDILEIPARMALSGWQPPKSDYAIIANIPYYITGIFLRTWLAKNPQYMVLMLQKEVAKRIIAADKKESLLSISVKLYGQPEYIETIKKGSFNPIPKVDSAILKIGNIATPNINEERFFELLKAGFAHKRKLLLSNLKEKHGEDMSKSLNHCQIDPKIRAEDITLENWKCLTSLSTDFTADK